MLDKYGIVGGRLSNSCVLPYDTWNLFKIRIYPHTTSGDTPFQEYRRFTVSSIKLVTSRHFQKWCSSGVVSALVLRETIDFTGFSGTFQDTAVAYVHLP